MRGWRNVLVAVGFFAVMAFVVERFSGVRTSPADLKDLGRDIASLGLFVLLNVALFLVAVYAMSALWKKLRGKPRSISGGISFIWIKRTTTRRYRDSFSSSSDDF